MAYLVVFGGLGMLAGSAARLLLSVLRRGARIAQPWCEISVGALWAATGYCWSAGWLWWRWVPLLLGLGWLVVAAGAVDLAHRRLPDALTLPALPAALLLAAPLGESAVLRAALCAVVFGGLHAMVRLVAAGALGGGDVKLAGSLGAVLGAVSWAALVWGAVLASLITALLAVCCRPRGRAVRDPSNTGVPHGPSMLLAGWLVVAVAGTGGLVSR